MSEILYNRAKALDSICQAMPEDSEKLRAYDEEAKIAATKISPNGAKGGYSADSRAYDSSMDHGAYLASKNSPDNQSLILKFDEKGGLLKEKVGARVTDSKGMVFVAEDGSHQPLMIVDADIVSRANDDFTQSWGTSVLQNTFPYYSEIFKQEYRGLGYNKWIGRRIQMADLSYTRVQLVSKQVVNSSLINKDGNTVTMLSSKSTQSNISMSVNYSERLVYSMQQLYTVDYLDQLKMSRQNISLNSEYANNAKEVFDLNDDAIGLFGIPQIGVAGVIDHPDLNPVITAPVLLVNGMMPPQALYALIQLIYSYGMQIGKQRITNDTKTRIAVPPFFFNIFTQLWPYVPVTVKNNINSAFNCEFIAWDLLDVKENGESNFMYVIFAVPGLADTFQPFANQFMSFGTKTEYRNTQTKVARVNIGGPVFPYRNLVMRFDLGPSSPTSSFESGYLL